MEVRRPKLFERMETVGPTCHAKLMPWNLQHKGFTMDRCKKCQMDFEVPMKSNTFLSWFTGLIVRRNTITSYCV
jgi:hypothetical protein